MEQGLCQIHDYDHVAVIWLYLLFISNLSKNWLELLYLHFCCINYSLILFCILIIFSYRPSLVANKSRSLVHELCRFRHDRASRFQAKKQLFRFENILWFFLCRMGTLFFSWHFKLHFVIFHTSGKNGLAVFTLRRD